MFQFCVSLHALCWCLCIEESITSLSLYRLTSTRKELPQFSLLEILVVSWNFLMDVYISFISLPPAGEVLGSHAFSQFHRVVLATISHPPLFCRAVHWNSETVGWIPLLTLLPEGEFSKIWIFSQFCTARSAAESCMLLCFVLGCFEC